ncbi:di-N-acetylchitobiase-like [Patiria miniata]|uniref:GH18 domain-containing protein n=1 Tax=Patiria miniata TaxID=46514 RepID=A0A914A8T4_PATMI|nr:di-N-acetylchitobiase-like [Patiria miniata]
MLFIMRVLLLVGCCFYGVLGDVSQSQCPCKDPSHCQLVKAPPRKELFVFRTGDKDDWKQYDWSYITTVAVFGPYDPDLMCYAHSKGARYVFSADYPAKQLNNATARSAWVKQQVNTALSGFLDGINIDFEATLSESEAPDLVALVNETAKAFKQANPHAQISFDTPYAPGCTWGRCYDYKNLSESCDFLVLMNYDMNADADMAISNDPFQRIKIGVESFQADGIPANKLVPAFPWYGYDYECTHVLKDDICSKIGYQRYNAPSPTQVCYSGITQMLKDLKMVGTLNSTFVSKFYDYTDKTTGKPHQVWYDDPETLTVRYLYAKHADLRGVAMWHAECLDYGPDPATQKLTKAMWDAIDEFFQLEKGGRESCIE